MNFVPKLKKLGFSENEAKVYLVLLKIGFSTSGPIIKKVGLHRNIVYDCLEKLIKRGLASETIQRGKKHFRPLSPDKILKFTKEHFAMAQDILPELEKLKKYQPQEVIIYEGKDGFQNAHLDAVEQMKKNSTIYVMRAGGKGWVENMGNAVKKFDRIRKEKNIKNKLIALENQRRDLELQKNRPLFGVKFLAEKFETPAGTAIYDDITLNIVYSDPVFVIAIKSPQVARGFKQYFNVLWKMAKK